MVTRPSEEEGVAEHVRVTAAADALSIGGEWAPERRPSQLGCGSGLGLSEKEDWVGGPGWIPEHLELQQRDAD